MVEIKNKSPRVFTAELEKFDGEEIVYTVTTHDRLTGKIGQRRLVRAAYPVLTIRAGQTVAGLPDKVLDCAQVAALIRRGSWTAKRTG